MNTLSHFRKHLASYFALLFVGCMVVVPCLMLLRVSFSEPTRNGFFIPGKWTLTNYRQLADGYGLRLLSFTLGFGLTVAVTTTLLAYCLAMFVRSLPPRSQRVAIVLVLLPKTAGLLAAIFGMQRWLPRGLVSAVLAEVYLILPYAVLILFVQLSMLDRTLEDAARGLGASRWQVFRRITLPLSFRGIVVAFQLALVWGMGAFLGPVFLGTPSQTTLAVDLHRQAFENSRWPRAATEAVVLLVVTLLVLTWSALSSRSREAPA